MGKHTVFFSLCSLTKANNAATISLIVLKGKWPLQLIAVSLPLNSSISSKHVFIAVSDFGAKKIIIWNLTPPVQFSVKIPTPRENVVVKCPRIARGDIDVSIWSAQHCELWNSENVDWASKHVILLNSELQHSENCGVSQPIAFYLLFVAGHLPSTSVPTAGYLTA